MAGDAGPLVNSETMSRILKVLHGLFPGWQYLVESCLELGILFGLVVLPGGSIGALTVGRSGMRQMRQSVLREHLACELLVGHVRM